MVLFREFHYHNTYPISPGLAGEVTPSHPEKLESLPHHTQFCRRGNYHGISHRLLSSQDFESTSFIYSLHQETRKSVFS
ncbi:hypothetical protein HanIR_Chr03g0129561 [Helianthus annuus]|nr:hypothetical protein HanIR_Chr03g0129561 [Helianthus annuus]